MKFLLLWIALVAGAAFAQAKPKKQSSLPPPPPPFYDIAVEARAPMRDLQLQWDELELDNQRKIVEIEKNHQKQQQIMDQLKVMVIKYAQAKQINLDAYTLDPKELKFTLIKSK